MLARVFDLFTQIGGSLERSQGGLGIGLTLVRRLVEMHDGNIEARSNGPDQGSEFVVRLPVFVPPPLETAKSRSAGKTPGSEGELGLDPNWHGAGQSVQWPGCLSADDQAGQAAMVNERTDGGGHG